MRHVITGLFHSRSELVHALGELRQAQVPERSEVRVTVHKGSVKSEPLPFAMTNGKRRMAGGIVRGVIAGVVLGALFFISGIAQGSWTYTLLLAAMIGAIAGALGGVLSGSGGPEKGLQDIEKQLGDEPGAVAVSLETDNESLMSRIENVFAAHGAKIEHKAVTA
jgi:outer membrane lipoprotein SlyB